MLFLSTPAIGFSMMSISPEKVEFIFYKYFKLSIVVWERFNVDIL